MSQQSISRLVGRVSEAVSSTVGKLRSLADRSDEPELRTVDSVDLDRYTGLWYELARLPVRFQGDEAVATAEYTALPDGSLHVYNRALRGGNVVAEISGRARPAEGAERAANRLRVTFDGLLQLIPVSRQGNYWVVELVDDDPDAPYAMALVGTPDRGSMWLLARDRHGFGSERAQTLLALARDQGFETDRLLVADWNREIAAPITSDAVTPADAAVGA